MQRRLARRPPPPLLRSSSAPTDAAGRRSHAEERRLYAPILDQGRHRHLLLRRATRHRGKLRSHGDQRAAAGRKAASKDLESRRDGLRLLGNERVAVCSFPTGSSSPSSWAPRWVPPLWAPKGAVTVWMTCATYRGPHILRKTPPQ